MGLVAESDQELESLNITRWKHDFFTFLLKAYGIYFFLLVVALAHTIGHVPATMSMSKVAMSFTHIIKSSEPAFSVLVSSLFLGEAFPLPVYLSILPIIGGCALAVVTELNFNMIGSGFGTGGY
ncbi:PREDICTED: glucose-6-phosphate/phosphate translocator 2, chloroplastic-like [Camelina sativa]|uniref:Glucose-6-phosphate/phosphate translocator 2, chloroplastic-like n=1 Tax=Camelina sativa TaxID=90675 RepID=A0ABM1Q754_CAMSA|nr:PREDICTED: glucose-6-phosphate/phosphate translocator 2, chloroplastic-like [Camelina sativa]